MNRGGFFPRNVLLAGLLILALAVGGFLVLNQNKESKEEKKETKMDNTTSETENGTPTQEETLSEGSQPDSKPISPAPQTNTQTPAPSAPDSAPTPTTVTLTFDGSRFSPSLVKVPSGGTLVIINNGDEAVQFQSDPHPEHTGNSQLNVGLINPGNSKSVTLTTKGIWGVHDHLNSSTRATVVVE